MVPICGLNRRQQAIALVTLFDTLKSSYSSKVSMTSGYVLPIFRISCSC